jgi:hypothetical protein
MRRVARRCAHPGVAVAITVAVLASCGGDDSSVVSPPKAGPTIAVGESNGCRIGGKSSQPASHGIQALVLGCWRLPDGRRLEVTGYREPRRAGGRLCIGYWLPLQSRGGGCQDDRVPAGRAIDPPGYNRLDDATTMLSGNASVSVGSVAMRLDSGERRSAGLARITRPQLLRRLRVSRPFGVYFAEVRTEALRSRHVVVEGGADGDD